MVTRKVRARQGHHPEVTVDPKNIPVTILSSVKPSSLVILPLPRSATLMVSVAGVRRNPGVRNTGIRVVASRKKCV